MFNNSSIIKDLAKEAEKLKAIPEINSNFNEVIENLYSFGIKRISGLSYILNSTELLQNGLVLKPQSPDTDGRFRVNLFSVNPQDANAIKNLNSFACSWIQANVVRSLDEFLQYYLLYIYDNAMAIDVYQKSLSIRKVFDEYQNEIKYERSSLNERLNILKRKFGIKSKYSKELVNLNRIRHVISHHDGNIADESLECEWLEHTIYAVKRDSSERINVRELNSFLDSNVYGSLDIEKYSTRFSKKFKKGESVTFTTEELQNLCSFYILCLDDLYISFSKYAKKANIKMKNFEDVSVKMSLNLEEA